MGYYLKRCVLLILILWVSTAAASPGTTSSSLQHNPFRKPQTVTHQRPPLAAPKPAEQEQPPQLELRATLVSRMRPLVNVGGTIVIVGEEIEGFRLLEVGEGEAVFGKGKKKYTLSIGKQDQNMKSKDE